MRTLCSSTLIGEFFVIGFAGLVAMKDSDLSMATVWTVCGIAMLLCVLLCGMVTRPGGRRARLGAADRPGRVRVLRPYDVLHGRALRGAVVGVVQGLLALGLGGVLGTGLGESKLAGGLYLPNAWNDFIYAIIGEEFGFVGAGIVIVLFILLAYAGIRIRSAADAHRGTRAPRCAIIVAVSAADSTQREGAARAHGGRGRPARHGRDVAAARRLRRGLRLHGHQRRRDRRGRGRRSSSRSRGWLRRETPRHALTGLVGIGFAAFVAARSGKAENFFLPGLLANAAYATAMLVSVAIRRPLIGYVVGQLDGEGIAWRDDPLRVRVFMRASLMWAALFALRLAVQLPLYLAGAVGALGVATHRDGHPALRASGCG